jgi:hypothetical protein
MKMLFWSAVGLACTVALGTCNAAIYNLSTSQGEFTSGVLNQGWWSDFGGNNTYNDNYIIALFWTAGSYPYPQGIVENDFFTFDLTGIQGTIQSATLTMTTGNIGSPNPAETIDFWDVQTPASVLNAKGGPSASIVNDLGSGKNYGSFQVPMTGAAPPVLSFSLNANAIADMNASLGGYFSIGGSMEGQPAPNVDRFVFGVTQGDPVQLQLVVVPEPGLGSLILLAGAGWAMRARKL